MNSLNKTETAFFGEYFWFPEDHMYQTLYFGFIYVRFCQLWANWTSQREGSGYRGTRAKPYSFSKEPSGSFTCPVYSTDTWDLGLKSHPKDFLVRRGIELTIPGSTVERATTRPRSAGPIVVESVRHKITSNISHFNPFTALPRE